MSRPLIHILATGGTIAGVSHTDHPAGRYTAGVRPVAPLLAAVPGLDDLAELSADQILSLDSKDMRPADWQSMLSACRRALTSPAVEGVVILHGTDTLEETAWFLHLTLPAGKPMVLTGAMRPADHPEADGPANILDAVRLATLPEARDKGVLITLNGRIHGARSLRKYHASQLDAFSSTQYWNLARADGRFAAHDLAPLPRVDILAGYAGAPACLVDACINSGARGLVLALAGQGSVPESWRAALARARDKGIPVIRASRCSGHIPRNGNADDDGEGYLTAGDLPPLKARIALMLALAAGMEQPEIQALLPTL